MTPSMTALVRDRYGTPDVLRIEKIQRPVPKGNEILIRVHATTINRTDCGILKGRPYLIRAFVGLRRPRHRIPGTDFAGEVAEVGSAVTSFEVGDRVWGLHDEGLQSHAQYMCIRADKAVALIPDGFSYQEAVACAEGAHYAYNFISKVGLKTGDKVLVNGGTGAIGSAAIQLLKAMDILVTAVGNTPNLPLLTSLGADKVVDYLKEDFTKDEERYHLVFDAVGKSSFSACRHLLLPKGIYISSELGPGAENLYLPLTTMLTGGKRVIFPTPIKCRRSILYLSSLMAEGRFKAVIDKRYTMEQIEEAYAYVMSGQKVGNVILEID